MLQASRWVAVAVLTLVAASACGGDDSDPAAADDAAGQSSTTAPGQSGDTADDAGGQSSAPAPAEQDDNVGGDDSAPDADGWVTVADEQSQFSASLPMAVEATPFEYPAGGATVTGRTYLYDGEGRYDGAGGRLGFDIYDVDPDTFDAEIGIENAAQSIGGNITSTSPIEVSGHSGMQGEIADGDQAMLVRTLLFDQGAVALIVSGPGTDLESLEADMNRVSESVTFG